MLIDFNIHGVSFFGISLPIDIHLEKSFSKWLPAEMNNVAHSRKQEYIAGRFCAVRAANHIGIIISSLPSADTREPVWPEGVVGSISHSKQLAISCVALSKEISSIGIDAEELIKLSLCSEIAPVVASQEELAYLKNFDAQKGLTILFSAKESLYKALFPLVRTFIDYKDVKLINLVADKGVFELELNSTNAGLSAYQGTYFGSFKQIGETIITVVLISKIIDQRNYVHT